MPFFHIFAFIDLYSVTFGHRPQTAYPYLRANTTLDTFTIAGLAALYRHVSLSRFLQALTAQAAAHSTAETDISCRRGLKPEKTDCVRHILSPAVIHTDKTASNAVNGNNA